MLGPGFEPRRLAFEMKILPGRLLKGMMTFHVVAVAGVGAVADELVVVVFVVAVAAGDVVVKRHVMRGM